jgi:hypothetical protein
MGSYFCAQFLLESWFLHFQWVGFVYSASDAQDGL